MFKRIPLVLAAALALTACPSEKPAPKPEPAKPEPAKPEPAKPALDRAKLAAFQPLPESFAKEGQTKAQEDLGRMLYFEKRLSKNHDVSCNSCHAVDKFGVDNNPTSPGHKGQLGGRNSPTSFNAAGHLAQFWDGRAADVEAQALGPILNPVEMALPDEKAAMKVLASMPEYEAAFKAAFPGDKEPIVWENVGKAIGAFERKLVTPGRFDKLLKGDDAALTADELKGLDLFVSTGCTTCHTGATVGGSMYQKLGLVKPWPNEKDQGRFDLTENDGDKMSFKVPSLRNIAKTGPYFHDGSIKTLDEAVKLMADHQLGKQLKDDEVKSIVTFLGALTGEVPADYVKAPELPKSTDKTPKPDPS
jgi:cytochrome c peroxidase